MTFTSTEGNGGPPIVLSKEPVPKPPFERNPHGDFMVRCRDTIAIRDVVSEHLATVVARIGDFICTFHRAEYRGWYTGEYGRFLAGSTLVTWERVGDSN